MPAKYTGTVRACFAGYIVQAVVNNFAPLLFLTFQTQFGIPISQITVLITLNFALQLAVDLASVFFIDRIGYRAAALLAHGFSAAGLIMLAVLPGIMDSPFLGLIIAVAFYAVGGGLLEVIISPIVEACPNDHKAKTMSLLHSFYCWGCVGVVGLSTLFFRLFGIENWGLLALTWAALPVVNGIVFTKVPIASLIQDGQKGLSVGRLFKNKMFWAFMLLMVCAGASEQAVSQWSSAFAESALGISKSVGDLAGPMLFSVLMGISRVIYGKFGEKINLEGMMLLSGGLCTASYLIAALTASPIFGLAGVALCGFSVGILWPGTFSRASASIKGGGTAMFALLALAGDLGCSGGPTFVGMIASAFGDDLKKGILFAVIFPVILTVCVLALKYAKRKKAGE